MLFEQIRIKSNEKEGPVDPFEKRDTMVVNMLLLNQAVSNFY